MRMHRQSNVMEDANNQFYQHNTHRIVALFLTIALIATVAAYSFLLYTHKQTNQRAIHTIRTLAESIHQNFDNIIGDIDFCLRVSSDELIERTDEKSLASFTNFLERRRSAIPFVSYIRATNAQGEVIYGTGIIEGDHPVNVADREYFSQLRDHADADIYISSPVISRINHQNTWIFARRVTGHHGEFLGVIFAGIFTDTITKMFNEIATENGEMITLRGKGYVFIARNDKGKVIKPADEQDDLRHFLPQREEGTFIGYEGEERNRYVHWYKTNQRYGFTIVVEVAEDVVFREWRYYAILIGSFLAGFLLLMFFLARSLIRSWNEHQAVAHEMRLSSLVFDNANDAIAITDSGNRFVRVNQSFCELTGYSEDEVLGQKPSILRSDRQAQPFYEIMWESLSSQGRWIGELWNQKKDGSIFAARLSITAIRNEYNIVRNYIAIAVDITFSKQAEQKLRELSQAVEQSPASVIICNVSGNITYVNQKFCDVTGYPREEVTGKNPRFLRSEHTPDDLYRELWQALTSGKEWRGEMKNRKKNGELFWEYSSFSPLKNSEGATTHYLAIKEDITIRKDYEERLIKQANFDSLTGLPNRLLAMDRLSQAIGRAHHSGKRVAVMFVDLDHFKKVNDTLGHVIGDKLLKQAGARLMAGVREVDTVARLGGDEFMIILADINVPADAEAVAEKVLAVCGSTFSIDQHELQLSASVGIAIYPDDDTDPHLLVRNADLAMYRSKDEGRGAFHFFTAAMDARAHENMVIESELRRALERNEFSVHYQPLVEIASNRIVGAEALIRWRSSKFGDISPAKFIPIAENCGLIVPIGEWVLCKACCDATQWQKESTVPLVVAVNVSTRQIERSGFLGVVKDALHTTGLAPHCLKLEITEGVLLRESAEIRKTIEDVCALGVRLSIDDFGTGYSSLSYLRRFPFDTLKVDRSFVQDLPHSPEAVNLVQAIVAMAHGLRMTVIGEGVETPAQKEFLQAIGCEISQGWLTGKPMPAAEFLARLKRERVIP